MAGLLICSDIHGDAISAQGVIDAFERHGAEKLVILGDILYQDAQEQRLFRKIGYPFHSEKNTRHNTLP